MLWYKAWCESRVRFLISAFLIIGVCAAVVMVRHIPDPWRGPVSSYVGYVYHRIYAGFLRGTFLILVLVLGLGGLARERAHGTVGFTLALPVSRWGLVIARAAVGLAEVAALAALPAMLMPSLSRVAGEAYPLSQALQFSLLWMGIGSLVFAAAFLASTVFLSEYTALTVSLVAFYVYPLLVTRIPALRGYPLHIHYLMNGTGMPYFDPHAARLVGPLPWTILSVAMAVTAGLIALAGCITQNRDYC